MIFESENEVRELYPQSFTLVDEENKSQFPEAKFLKAAVFNRLYPDSCADLILLFDINSKDYFLYVTTQCDCDEDLLYLDEYYEIPKEDILDYLDPYQ